MIRHESQRGYFAYALYNAMKRNKKIYLICIDLGYKVFDQHFKDFEKRCINTGVAEQVALDFSIGLALDDKIPFVYSITPFLLYRPFEALRTYINHEKIPVKLIGSGRDYDYRDDGWSHHSPDDKDIMACLPNIKSLWPETKEQVPELVKRMIKDNAPYYCNLTRT